jgi:hypothetical protein
MWKCPECSNELEEFVIHNATQQDIDTHNRRCHPWVQDNSQSKSSGELDKMFNNPLKQIDGLVEQAKDLQPRYAVINERILAVRQFAAWYASKAPKHRQAYIIELADKWCNEFILALKEGKENK